METEKLFSTYSEYESWIINNKEKVFPYMINIAMSIVNRNQFTVVSDVPKG